MRPRGCWCGTKRKTERASSKNAPKWKRLSIRKKSSDGQTDLSITIVSCEETHLKPLAGFVFWLVWVRYFILSLCFSMYRFIHCTRFCIQAHKRIRGSLFIWKPALWQRSEITWTIVELKAKCCWAGFEAGWGTEKKNMTMRVLFNLKRKVLWSPVEEVRKRSGGVVWRILLFSFVTMYSTFVFCRTLWGY